MPTQLSGFKPHSGCFALSARRALLRQVAWWRTNCQKENMSGEGFLDTAGPSRSCSMRRPTRFKPTRNCLRGVTRAPGCNAALLGWGSRHLAGLHVMSDTILARRAIRGLRKQISPLYERTATCDKPGGRCVAKMTPVGFEPTPFRNGALSHRLRPLGQSVHARSEEETHAHHEDQVHNIGR